MNDWKHELPRAKKWKNQKSRDIQVKLDGHRVCFFIQPDGNVVAYGRRMEDHLEFMARYPRLLEHPIMGPIKQLPPLSSVDCELVTGSRSSVKTALINPDLPLMIQPFGLGFYDGARVYPKPLHFHDSIMKTHSLEIAQYFCFNDFVKNIPEKDIGNFLIGKADEMGYEGWILKDGEKWFKVKKACSVDCIIVGITPGQGKYRKMLGSIICSVYDDDGNLVEVANASGMTDGEREVLTNLHNRARLIGKVVEIGYQIVGSRGRLTHPRFNRMRPDKPQKECTIDQIKES